MRGEGWPTRPSQDFTLVVGMAAPAIVSGNAATFTVGSTSTFTVVATGSPVPALSESGTLPTGVTFNATTGALSGAPTATGSFPITFTASNGVNPNATQSFTLTVDAAGTDVYYYVEDALGSSRVITTSNGTVCYDADFYPYGGERPPYTDNCPVANNYKFMGKERDGSAATETGLDDFGARYYASTYGRFMAADWSAVPAPVPYANLTNPETLNLYAIVHDDPITFADLDGHDDCSTAQDANQAGCQFKAAWNREHKTTEWQKQQAQQQSGTNTRSGADGVGVAAVKGQGGATSLINRGAKGIIGLANVVFGVEKVGVGSTIASSAPTGLGAVAVGYLTINGTGQTAAGIKDVQYAYTGNEAYLESADKITAATTLAGVITLARGGDVGTAAFWGSVENGVPNFIGSGGIEKAAEALTTLIEWANSLRNSANPGP